MQQWHKSMSKHAAQEAVPMQQQPVPAQLQSCDLLKALTSDCLQPQLPLALLITEIKLVCCRHYGQELAAYDTYH